MSALELINIRKNYGPIAVLPPISCTLAPGRALGLWGPTGCGKTTLLRIIAGLLEPDDGALTLDGRPANTPAIVLPPAARGVGMVFQELALWPHMTAQQHLKFVLKPHCKDRVARCNRASELLAEADLAPHAAKRPGELSRGQRQRLALARAFASNPRLLLLDEPISSQDAAAAHRMLESVRRRKATGAAVVIAAHDRDQLKSIADDVLVFGSDTVRIVPVDGFTASM